MVYFKDPQTYLEQSNLLVSARPTTVSISPHLKTPPSVSARLTLLQTRITTKYTLPRSDSTRTKPSDAATATPAQSARAILTLKTYDPVSGTCLKYRTDKAAEVGRLVAGLGRCARVMAAVPVMEGEKKGEGEGEVMETQSAVGRGVGAETTAGPAVAPKEGKPQTQHGQGQGKAAGGISGKKKGKR